MSFLKHKEDKKILLEIEKGMVSLSEILKNLVKMQAVSTNKRIKVTTYA